ncbi:MAG: phosphatidate cytidylyltransferase [Proteobacteria bacterium]|nr:phosphatidate cytidylyltransferase [Pseudomonadota bacterium]
MAYTVWLPRGDLLPRTLTGLVAIPAVIFTIFQGQFFLKIIGVLAAFGLLREWSNLSFSKPYHWLSLVCFASIVLAFFPDLRVGALLMTLAGCGWFLYLKAFKSEELKVICFGYLYITSAMAIIIHILPNFGVNFTLLVLTLIWSVDTGAFLAGRTFGGPKLAPAISPNKTWSGFIGGVIAGLSAVVLLTKVMNIVSVLLAQGGDLLESWCKRFFKAKDSGNFLPGHGGMLDRLDSLLAVSFAIAVLWYFCG